MYMLNYWLFLERISCILALSRYYKNSHFSFLQEKCRLTAKPNFLCVRQEVFNLKNMKKHCGHLPLRRQTKENQKEA